MSLLSRTISVEKKSQLRQFYFLSFSSLLHFAILGLLSPYIAIYFKQESLPFVILFLIFLANNLGNISQPLWGGLSDRFDKRKIFIVNASVFWTLFGVFINFLPDFFIFVLFFGIASLFGSAVQPAARSLISFYSIEGEETEYQTKYGVLLSTAFSISAWIGGIIVDFFGFYFIFITVMILGVISLLLSIFTIKDFKMEEYQFLRENSDPNQPVVENHKEFSEKRNIQVRFSQKLRILLKNPLYIAILIFSFFGGFSFYFFFNFISVFFEEMGLYLSIFSWSFIISFISFLCINYFGEAIVKRKIEKKIIENHNTSKEANLEKSVQKNEISKILKMIFIFWSIIGFLILCVLITFIPDQIIIIMIVYCLPIVPFFFTSMLALTTSVVDIEYKAVAIGIQGVFVFGGRALTSYLGSIFLDLGGFSLAAFINLFFMIILLTIGIYTFRKLKLI